MGQEKMNHKPKKFKESYAWQCAFPDAQGSYILHSFVWDMLSGYYLRDGLGLYKYYKTEEEAIEALQRTVDIIRQGMRHYD